MTQTLYALMNKRKKKERVSLETMLSKPTNTPKLLFGYFSNVLENYY
jgi:hypothetical protein